MSRDIPVPFPQYLLGMLWCRLHLFISCLRSSLNTELANIMKCRLDSSLGYYRLQELRGIIHNVCKVTLLLGVKFISINLIFLY